MTMRSALGLLFTVVVAACGGTPPASSAATAERDASTAVVTAPDAGTTPAPEPSTPEVAALRKCDDKDPALKAALESAKKLAAQGPIADRALVDAVWSCFDRFRPSQASSVEVVKALMETISTVKDPSWGPKAVTKISAPVNAPKDPNEGMDQVQFWQAISVRLLGDLRYGAGARALVAVLLDDKKADLALVVRAALAKMPKDAEPVLIAALTGSDAELAETAKKKSADEAWFARVGDSLAFMSRPAGRDAVLDSISKTQNDVSRAILALDLTRFPTTPATTKAFQDAYAKVPASTSLRLYGGMNARAMLAGATPGFFDPSFADWLLKENAAAAKDANAGAFEEAALQAAIKMMTATNASKVGAAVEKVAGQTVEKRMYKNALGLLNACKKNVGCYLKELEKPVPTSHAPEDRIGHVKAAWMAGIYGDATTRATLVDRLVNLREGTIRLAILDAVDQLAPKGDAATADKLEALVTNERADTARAGLDEIFSLAIRLRARAL